MIDVNKISKERADSLIYDLEDWMCLVGRKEDWLIDEEEDGEKIFGSKAGYLLELIDWVKSHVCKEDGRNPKWWISHGFTESEAELLAE